MNQSTRAPRNSKAAPKKKKTRMELDMEARERKRQKKHRGRVAGSRANPDSAKTKTTATTERDPRLGSKVPVALIVNDKAPVKAKTNKVEKRVVEPRLSPQEELDLLENDDRLDALLEKLENGAVLNEGDQQYVDKTLDRIDELMEQLGISLDDEEEEDAHQDDLLKLLKSDHSKKSF